MIQNLIFSSPSFFSFFFIFLYSLSRFFILCSSVNPNFETCNRTTCGDQIIKYPFYIQGRQESFCGFPGFALICSDNGLPILNISNYQYIIHDISYHNQSIRLSEAAGSSPPNATSSSSSSCSIPLIHNITLDGTRFHFDSKQKDLFLLYGCNMGLLPGNFSRYKVGCSSEENETISSVLGMTAEDGGDFRNAWEKCNGGIVKTRIDSNETKGGEINGDLVRRGIVLKWIVSSCNLCEETGGKCGFDSKPSVFSFKCYCPDRDHSLSCDLPVPASSAPAPEDKSRVLKLRLGIGGAMGSVGVVITVFIVILLWNKRRNKSLSSKDQSRSNESDNTHSNAILEGTNIYYGVPLFSNEELEEATNKFDQSRELGSGGFGTVYHGKLKDGREVAVKRLFERNYRGVQQFMNEVKILTRLRHRNLVSLYGCTSSSSHELLLVYEYIPNGTLGCYLHGNLAKPGSLPWSVRMRIAIETANALSYLHASGIIHRDVKSSNLLLDHHFVVKVADFGISRLFPKQVSHVSTAPAGTPGYLDPQYYLFSQLTEKSDVYSFGVVLIELISSKPAIFTRETDMINLANMAVKKIQRSAFSELVDPSLGFESDDKVREMIISVAKLAFRCLQSDRELRPSMDKVMEFLQKIENGNHDLKNLEIHGAGFPIREDYESLPTSVHGDGTVSSNNSEPQYPHNTV